MEFWGVEVKPGQSLKVQPEFEKLIHISQAALGEVKDVKGGKNVHLRMKIDDKDFIIGTLSAEDRTQLMFDLVFEREFELSHDWKHGSVYFIGYIADDQVEEFSDESDDESEDESEDEPLDAHVNGEIKPKSLDVKAAISTAPVKAEIKKEGQPGPEEDDESDSDDEMALDGLPSDSDDVSGEDDGDEDDKDEDEELPKVQQPKKRPAESPQKTPFYAKKAKSATPDKTGNKVHTATPFPSKATGRTPAGNNSKQKTPKSGGQFAGKSNSKTFPSGNARQSHGKGKHGGK